MIDERKLIEAIQHECKLNVGGLYEEDIIKIINEHFDNNNARTVQNLVSEIDKLEKALDKACDRLDFFDHLYGDDEYEDWKTKEQWKEWCMKDD